MPLSRSGLRRGPVLLLALTALSFALGGTCGGGTAPVVSDDFNHPELKSRWSFVDPVGDASWALTGAGTGDAHLELTVPEGTSHDGLHPNTSARMMQAAPNDDFEVEVKFDSPVTERFQMQGLLAKEDADDYIRFEFFSDGSDTRVYAETTTGGSATARSDVTIAASSPLYMRVSRTGDEWVQSWSSDGESWTEVARFTHGLALQKLGLSAGNAGGDPAHTARVDYFENTASPIEDEDGLACASTESFSLQTSTEGQGTVSRDPDRSTYDCGEVVTVDAVPDSGWIFAEWKGDLKESETPRSLLVESDLSITARFVEDTFPPTISDVETSVTETSATVSWSTNEPATSEIRYGETTDYALGTISDPTLVTEHGLTVSGLDPDTEYHYELRSTDAEGNEAVTSDLTFRTAPPLSDVPVASDDFNRRNLEDDPWTFVSPSGSARIELSGAGTSDAWASLGLPAGVAHPIGAAGNDAARLEQTVENGNFELETRLESEPLSEGTSAGLYVSESESRFVHAGLERRDDALHLVAASVADGAETVHVDRTLAEGAPHHLRLDREGTEWTLAYSSDGTSWASEPAFTTNLTAGAAGVFAASEGSAPPSFRADVDYVFDTAAPIEPEDGGTLESDTTPPFLHAISASASATSLQVSWGTDEPADGFVEYGETSSLELGSVGHTDLRTSHVVDVDGLSQETVYHFRVVSSDGAGNTSASETQTLQTGTLDSDGPSIRIWYGDPQTFGGIGVPQRFVNVLGNARDSDGVDSLTYSLNGGPELELTLGGKNVRLVSFGDFNVEIPFLDLRPGPNEVRLRAVDGVGNVSTRTVDLEYVDGEVWPLPYSVDWSLVPTIEDAAQVVDGKWEIGPEGVRTVETGYDRLIAIGDLAWTDYEAEVPITVHSVGALKQAPLVGLAVRWTGHYDWDGSQPRVGWHPLGGILSHTWRSDGFDGIEVWRPDGDRVVRIDDVPEIQLDVPYVFKVRIDELSDGQIRYRFKLWPQGDAEPTEWLVDHPSEIVPPAGGSLLLLAHYVDASFGDLTIRPVTD